MPTKMTMRPKRVTACLNQSSLENQKYIDNGKTAVNNNKLILITRLTVTMMAYRKCKTSARYRSKLTAVIAKNDSKIKEDPIGYNTAPVMQYSGKLSVNTPIRCAENNGWTTAAVTKSDNARQNRCTEEGVCSEGVWNGPKNQEVCRRTRKAWQYVYNNNRDCCRNICSWKVFRKNHWADFDMNGIAGLGVIREVARKIHGTFQGEIFI